MRQLSLNTTVQNFNDRRRSHPARKHETKQVMKNTNHKVKSQKTSNKNNLKSQLYYKNHNSD